MKYYVRLARYTLEKDIITEFPNDLGLVLPANLLLYYGKSIAQYIKNTSKSYFIDPMTYVFTHPKNMLKADENNELEKDESNDYKLKKSYENLVKSYGSQLFDLFRSNIPLSPSYFDDSNNLKNFIENNVEYQKNALKKNYSKISKYEIMLGLSGSGTISLEPEFITAPYFYFNSFSDPWYAINIKLSRMTKSVVSDKKMFSVLCFNKSLLFDSSLADRISKDFNESDGFLLYISDLDETSEVVPTLKNLKLFIGSLYVLTKKPIINLYGTFFSVLLNYSGLYGVSSGMCILQQRDATKEYPRSWAPIRFYIPSTHNKIAEDDLITIYLEKFEPTEECSCSFCLKISKMKESLPPREYVSYIAKQFKTNRGEIMQSIMRHFLNNKLYEIDLVNSNPLETIRRYLKQNETQAEKYIPLLNIKNYPTTLLSVI